MSTRSDSEIEVVEARIARERAALAALVEGAGERARTAVASPPVMAGAAALGFLLGRVLHGSGHRGAGASPEAPRRKGITGLVGGLVLTGLRLRYGSPLGALQAVFGAMQARRQRPAARPQSAGTRGTHAPPPPATSGAVARPVQPSDSRAATL